MQQKILITGGSGLLALNWALIARDHYEVILGLHRRNITLSKINTRIVNLETVDSFRKVVKEIKPHIIIHAAGLTNVEECEANPGLAYHTNVQLAVNVAQVCAENNLFLVHISTDHLFSGDVLLVNEFSPLNPKNTYGKTKAEAEMRVLETYPSSIIIRTNFYGWGSNYRRSFSDLIITSLRVGKELTLFQDVFYTPILIETLAKTAQDLINIRAKGIFHVVGDERISKYEFGLKIAKNFKLDTRVIKAGLLSDRRQLIQRPHEMSLSNEKVCGLLNRKLGGVDEQLQRLCQQEELGLVREVQNL